jgi:amidase
MPFTRDLLSRRAFMASLGAMGATSLLSPPLLSFAEGEALVPVTAPQLTFASALEAASAILKREVSSLELTQELIDRIDRFNPAINAIVTLTREAALERARAADQALARGEVWGPFHGVPITIKDTYEVQGVRSTAGAPQYADHIPERDATVVTRMRAAGAVILGKTNTPTMAADVQTYNDVFGQTNNPWNPDLTCGGSTGGGAAALAAGLTYLSMGSDIGGSIRTPAGFCGVYGHKPTIDVVSREGHIPPPIADRPVPPATLAVAGPLARSAADLRAALQIVGGPDSPHSIAYQWTLPPARKKALSEYKIGYVMDDPLCPVVPEVRAVHENAIDALRKAGADLHEGWPVGVDPNDQYRTYFYLLMAQVAEHLPPEQVDFLRRAAGTGAESMLALRSKAWSDTHVGFKEAEHKRMAARQLWQSYFQDFDAFLMPVTFVPAFPHDHSRIEFRMLNTSLGRRTYLDLFFWISFASLTGLPATSAPVGRTPDGLPVALQIVGPFLEDATPIDIAERLAGLIGGFTPPPGYEASAPVA